MLRNERKVLACWKDIWQWHMSSLVWEIATGYLDHWLPMDATLATYDTGYPYGVDSGYPYWLPFSFSLQHIVFEQAHHKVQAVPYSNSRDGAGASYVGRLHVIIMLVTFPLDQINGTLLIKSSASFISGIRHWFPAIII